jgi:chemosensory pili system protein ChpA (sensor histidine kinase/response regulator)
MNRKIDTDILAGFLVEVTGYMPIIREGLLKFQANPSDTNLLEEPHRCVHTIKGAASMVGLSGLSHISYQVEEILQELLHGQIQPEPATFEGIEFGLIAIETYLEGLESESFQEDTLVQEAVAALRQMRGMPASDNPSSDGDLIPSPQFNLFDTCDDLPALGEMDTVGDGEFPAPDFTGFPEMPNFDAPPAPPKKPIVPTQNDIAQELLEVFRLEAEDHLRAIAAILPNARKETIAKEQWLEVRRAAHTLKGAAAMVGFQDVTTLAHQMEDLLDKYYEGTENPTLERVELLLASADAIEDSIGGRPAQFAPLFEQFAAIKTENPALAPVVEAKAPVAEEPKEDKEARREAGESYVRVPLSRLNDVVRLVGELVISRTAFEQRMSDFHRLLNELEPSTTRLRRASAKIETGFEARALAGGRSMGGFEGTTYGESINEFDALEFDRYTEFHLLSRELAETTNDIQTLGGELNYLLGDFDGHLTRQSRLGSEIEDKLMRMRMVPLSSVAPRLQRTVRNAAQQTNKSAELVIVGERTGLDKAVLEMMNDPLLHLLRNAVDHGLESAEVRRALGKPEQGTITITAAHEGSQVVLTIADDGRGIDTERVRATAVKRDLVSAEVAAALSDAALFELMFLPGFSTKGEISELSGRGVGLDVVRSKVEGLKGTVHATSTIGRGTSFVVRLPMTLAVARALLVRANRQTFAIPLEVVEQIVRLEPDDAQVIGGSRVYRTADRVYPITPLAQLLKLKTSGDESVSRPPMVLLRAGDQRLAVVVDQLVGGREIVIKNLGTHMKRVPGVSGATLMGDGSVVLILNPAEFVRAAVSQNQKAYRTDAVPARQRKQLSVMVVDDSPSVRRVLTTLIERNGWSVITAKDGLDAVEILNRGQTPPDIVLSDIEMPRMDGYELLSSIRNQPATRKVPVVMITSRSADKHRNRAVELGASAYVTKPYRDESLTELIRQLAVAR